MPRILVPGTSKAIRPSPWNTAKVDPTTPSSARKDVVFQRIRFCTAQQTCSLRHVHEQKILPRRHYQNIFLAADGKVKLRFRISRLSTMTNFATVIGTPNYLSLEIWDGKQYDSRSDVWALGCVLCEVAALEKTFNEPDIKSLIGRSGTVKTLGFASPYDVLQSRGPSRARARAATTVLTYCACHPSAARHGPDVLPEGGIGRGE